MKRIIKIGIVLLLCAVIGVTVSTATENDKLPTKDEVTTFLTEMKGSSPSDILNKVKEDHSTWNADLIECSACSGDKEAIALYYKDSGSKGYGSIYYKDGEIVSPSSLKGYTVKESYKGELEKSTNETEENTSNPTEENTSAPEENKIIEVDDSSEHTYNDLSEFLDDYKGETKYSQENIDDLQDAFLNAGWNTEIRYCIAVNTSDEGLLHIVLGA